MGIKQIISDVTFSDTSLPMIYDDAIMSKGSLFLWDPSHSKGGFAGVPIAGTQDANKMPNVAWMTAKAALGLSTTQSALSLGANVNVSSANVAGEWLVERTGKGGVHGLISQVNNTANPKTWNATLPANLRDYIRARWDAGQKIYISMWRRRTRAHGSGNVAPQSWFHCAPNTGSYYFYYDRGAPSPTSGLVSDGNRLVGGNDGVAAINGGTPVFGNLEVHGKTGSGAISTSQSIEFGLGTFGAWTGFNLNKCASTILYRLYIEDLTLSGRTYAQVDAIDKAMFDAAFAEGGRFYADTFTDPASMP